MIFFFFIGIIILAFYKVNRKILKENLKKSNFNSNTTILITGACQGIGKLVSLLFAKKFNSHIIALDIQDDLSIQLVQEIEKAGGKCSFYKCDVTDEENVNQVAKEVLEKCGKIDILINNAGIVFGKSFDELTTKQIQKVMDVNYMGPVRVLKAFLPSMKKINSGHIVSIASLVSIIYNTDVSEYTASKWALYALHSSLRLELKREKSNIYTTVICPWAINTGMFHGFKARFDIFGLFKMLEQEKVAEYIVDAIIHKKEIGVIPSILIYAFRILLLLPTFILDGLQLYLGQDSMKNFVGRHRKID